EAGSGSRRRIAPDRAGRGHRAAAAQDVEELVAGAAVWVAVDEVAESGTPPPLLERSGGRTHAVLAVPKEFPHEERPAEVSGPRREVEVDRKVVGRAQIRRGLARAEDLRARPPHVAAAEGPADRDVRIRVDPHLEGFAKEAHDHPLLGLEVPPEIAEGEPERRFHFASFKHGGRVRAMLAAGT